jgi:hypothetical protein
MISGSVSFGGFREEFRTVLFQLRKQIAPHIESLEES